MLFGNNFINIKIGYLIRKQVSYVIFDYFYNVLWKNINLQNIEYSEIATT